MMYIDVTRASFEERLALLTKRIERIEHELESRGKKTRKKNAPWQF